MSLRSMEQGIEAIRQGRLDEGGRLLRIALRGQDLSGPLRAAACVWLAETITDRDEKIQCYRDALNVDRHNKHAQRRLSQLLTDDFVTDSAPPLPPSSVLGVGDWRPGTPSYQQGSYQQQDWRLPPIEPDDPLARTLPPTPASYGAYNPSGSDTGGYTPLPPQPLDYTANSYDRSTVDMGGGSYGPPTQPPVQPPMTPLHNVQVVAVLDGPNGTGSGFFVNQRGVVATTRFVVSALERVRVDVGQGRVLAGAVSWSLPQYDLAFIETGARVQQLLQASPQQQVPPRMPLRAVNYDGRLMGGECRATERDIPRGWFPTTISNPMDAGGNPVFDQNNYLVGMLTRNTSPTSSFVYGLSIAVIAYFLKQYEQERQALTPPVYCPTCGFMAQAHNAGGYYCERCGAVLGPFQSLRRFPQPFNPQTAAVYNESHNVPCRHCGAQLGYHNNKCLRCGRDQ